MGRSKLDEWDMQGAENVPVLPNDDLVSGRIDFGSENRRTKASLQKQMEFNEQEDYFEGRTKRMSKQADKQLAVFSSDSPHRTALNMPLDLDENEVVNLEDILAEPEIELLGYGVLSRVLPKGIGSVACDTITDMINSTAMGMDSVMGEHFRDNCITWIDTVKGTRYSARQFLDAVKYVTHRLSGDSQTRAYARTFPNRINRMEQDGISNTNLSSYVNSYNNSKLVADIYAQALIPTHIMYNDFFHKAILVQAEIMSNDKVSPKVRSDAANSLMQHLKTPESKKAELAIKLEDNDVISQLKDAMVGLAQAQVHNVQHGHSKVIDIAEAEIIKE